MTRLKSDLVVNDNSWVHLLDSLPRNLMVPEGVEESNDVDPGTEPDRAFATTFDSVCRKHTVKVDQRVGPKQVFPRKLKAMLQRVKHYSTKCSKARGTGRIPEEIDVICLAHAQKRFRAAKKEWDV
jgi:hypothetical protein